MSDTLTLYHGSPCIVDRPRLEMGNPRNDYGRGFYCTQDFELACEWACKRKSDGFVNSYRFATANLKVLDLLCGQYSSLHWIALLLANREFTLGSEVARMTRDVLLERYLLDTAPYDIIIGYRADDAYFAYAEAFVENALSLEGLEKALRLGRLGEQVVLASQPAFDAISFVEATPVSAGRYYPKFIARDSAARRGYRNKIAKQYVRDGLFALDIVRGEKEDIDARVRRISR